jgi:1-deoxy-D-xylulose-5-phosphate reductoisomerase
VEAFLNGSLRWVDIPSVLEAVIEQFHGSEPRDVTDVLEADAEARALARDVLSQREGLRPLGQRGSGTIG